MEKVLSGSVCSEKPVPGAQIGSGFQLHHLSVVADKFYTVLTFVFLFIKYLPFRVIQISNQAWKIPGT